HLAYGAIHSHVSVSYRQVHQGVDIVPLAFLYPQLDRVVVIFVSELGDLHPVDGSPEYSSDLTRGDPFAVCLLPVNVDDDLRFGGLEVGFQCLAAAYLE